MPNYFVQLPAPQVPRNALLDLSPINNALDGVREQNNSNRNALLQQSQLDMQRENQTYQRGRDQKADARQQVQRAGEMADAIMRMPDNDPAKHSAWQKYLTDYGDGDHSPEELDFRTGPKIAAAAAGKFLDPNAGMTNDTKEYNLARSQGYGGTFLDYQTQLKSAGAARTSINTDMRAENAESKARGEGVGKRLNTIADDGFEAQKDAVMLDRIAGLGSNVDPGTKTAAFEAIRAATGIALDPNTDNVQAFQAAVNYMVPRMRVPGSGATSDFDAQTFIRSLPSLYGTPEGNRIITETLGGMNQNRLTAGRIAQRWQRGEITAQEADAEFQKLPDAFASFRKASPGMNQQQAKDLPTMSPAQAARLPAGTRFRGADGKVRVKQ